MMCRIVIYIVRGEMLCCNCGKF